VIDHNRATEIPTLFRASAANRIASSHPLIDWQLTCRKSGISATQFDDLRIRP